MSRWSRNIHRCAPTTAALDVAPLMEDPAAWARSTMRSLHLEWLLAHSGDGVTWGRLGRRLATSISVLAEYLRRFAARVCTTSGCLGLSVRYSPGEPGLERSDAEPFSMRREAHRFKRS